MACLNENKLLSYIDKGFNRVEESIIRDHLVVCSGCRKKLDQLTVLENLLIEPQLVEPPKMIVRNVMRKLYPVLPTYTPVVALIAASLIFIITWIYLYFDFANNSVFQAVSVTSHRATQWIGSVIKFITTGFTVIYAAFKSINAFIEAVFHVNLGADTIAIMFLLCTAAVFYFVSRFVLRKFKREVQ